MNHSLISFFPNCPLLQAVFLLGARGSCWVPPPRAPIPPCEYISHVPFSPTAPCQDHFVSWVGKMAGTLIIPISFLCGLKGQSFSFIMENVFNSYIFLSHVQKCAFVFHVSGGDFYSTSSFLAELVEALMEMGGQNKALLVEVIPLCRAAPKAGSLSQLSWGPWCLAQFCHSAGAERTFENSSVDFPFWAMGLRIPYYQWCVYVQKLVATVFYNCLKTVTLNQLIQKYWSLYCGQDRLTRSCGKHKSKNQPSSQRVLCIWADKLLTPVTVI